MSAQRGVDRAHLRALLRAYFRLSIREAALVRTRTEGRSSFVRALVLYAVVGTFISLSALTRLDVFVFSSSLCTMTFFVVGMAAIIEANEVLFDRRQELIFSPLPVDPATLLLAKALTLIGFASLTGLALNLVPMFAGIATTGARPWFPLVHLASVLLLTAFACAAVVCAYGVVLRLFGRERFENLAVWAQVGMVVLYMAGFQILPRMLDLRGRTVIGQASRWLLLSPPGWFAALDATLAGSSSYDAMRAAATLAVLAPAGLGWIALTRLSQGYADPAPVSTAVVEGKARGKPTLLSWRSGNPLLGLWLRDPVEWGAFRLAVSYLRRDREVKVRVYNVLAVFAVFAVISILDARRGPAFVPIMMLAYSATAALSAMDALQSSSHFAAAQIFAYSPLGSAAALFHGVRKMCLLYILWPAMLASLAFLLVLRSDRLFCLALALPIVVVSPTLTLIQGAFGHYLPLSRPPRAGEQSSRRSTVTIVSLFAMMGLMGVAYGALRVQSLALYAAIVALEILVTVPSHWWLRRRIARQRLEPA
jgi:hypothetical protein